MKKELMNLQSNASIALNGLKSYTQIICVIVVIMYIKIFLFFNLTRTNNILYYNSEGSKVQDGTK